MSSSGEEGSWSSDPLISRDEYGQSRPKMKKEQKRRPKPKDGTSLTCGVCGDKALGYNFDAVTCESCKAFFRRNALKTKTFSCSFDGNCKMDPHTRKFCSGCRLKKCFTIGMKKDWILNDDQLAKRRKRLPVKEDQVTPHPSECERVSSVESTPGRSSEVSTNYHSDSRYSPSQSDQSAEQQSPVLPSNVSSDTTPKSEPEDTFPVPLPEELRIQIVELEKNYTNIFDAAYQDVQAVRLESQPNTANDLFNKTDVFIRRLIKFAKLLPEFKSLPQEDQISLLKGGIMEIFVLRSAMGFDKQQQMWKYKMEGGSSSTLNPNMIKHTIGNDMYSNHLKFILSYHELTGGNRITMILIFMIKLFAIDRPGLVNIEMVAKARDKYSNWLQLHLESLNSVAEARILFPKLLMKLEEVRNLGESSSKIASQLDISKLEPLLVEVFNLNM